MINTSATEAYQSNQGLTEINLKCLPCHRMLMLPILHRWGPQRSGEKNKSMHLLLEHDQSKQFTCLPVSMVTMSLVEDVRKTDSPQGSKQWQEQTDSFKQAGRKTQSLGDSGKHLLRLIL